MIDVRIKESKDIAKCIALLRKYDKTLKISDTKAKIEKHDFILKHDCNAAYNITDDLHNIDRNMLFRELLDQLMRCGAKIEIYNNGREISLAVLDNWLKTLKEIAIETQEDMDRELE